MRSSRRSLTRASSIGFGTLFLAVSYACSERAVAPTAADDTSEFTVNAILSSSLWRVKGSDLAYAGSATTQARVTQDKNGVHQDLQNTTAATDASVPPLASSRFSRSTLQAPSTNKLALPEGAPLMWRTKLQSPRINLSTRDGKHVSLQRVADPRGNGRPPVATMLYEGDRPVSVIEALYEKDGKRWKPTRSRITLFGKDGKPTAVTETNFSALQTASVAMPGTAGILADGFRHVGGTLSKLVQPDALYAASIDDDLAGRCFQEAVLLAAAAAAQVSADIALGLALAACSATGLACPAVIAAMLTVSATAVIYLVRLYDYDQCMNPPPPPDVRPSGSGGGGGGSEGDGCYDVYWEISYDDGWSWQFFDTQRVCGHNS